MPEPTMSDAASPKPEDQAIREQVKGLTSQVLQQGRFDPDAVRDIVRTVIGAAPDSSSVTGAEARERFAAAIRDLDVALMDSARATHEALQQLGARGKDFTENDLKEALASLGQLQQDYAAAASRIADAMTGNLRREVMELAARAQNVGVEASARVASMMGDFAGGIGSAPGMATIRDASVRVALLASGVLAGVADALRDQSEAKGGK
jgi:Family of unknown function (DUF6781)